VALPAVVAHADWGATRRKRQVAVARLVAGARDIAEISSSAGVPGYLVTSLAPAPDGGGPDGDLLQWLAAAAAPGRALVGFDFPIGLPRAYARATGVASFPRFLDVLGSPPWQEFSLVASRASEITLLRPFYPAAPGGTRREHLYQGLGLAAAELRRRCEGTDAETLFWTLGGKQVGKAALSGWRLLSVARRRQPPVVLWPFAGPLAALLDGPGGVVAAEAYPREYYRYVRPAPRAASQPLRRPGLRWSKRRRDDRLAWMPGVLAWADSLGVTWQADIRRRVEGGLSPGADGEDEFDAVIGLLGVIAAATGILPSGEPADDPAITATEGWILGRQSRPGWPGCCPPG
jgi:hypothetical protein